MNKETRIDISDTLFTAISKLSEGNPGSITAMAQMMKEVPDTDPEDAFGVLGFLLSLDSFGIYGSRIWCLFKDVCGCNARHALACLRSVQMGILPESELKRAIDGQSKLDLEVLIPKLVKELPSFKPG